MEVKLYIIAILAVSSLLSLSYAWYGLLRFRRVQGGPAYIGLMLGAALYSGGYAFELCNETLPGIYLALRIEYLGIACIPACILLLALQYTDIVRRPPALLQAGLFVIPLVTIVLLNTNQWHHWYYASLGVDASGLFPVADIKAGPWYFVQVVYYNIAFAAASILYVRMIIKERGFFTRQAAALFMTACIPWVSYCCICRPQAAGYGYPSWVLP
jgi:hypothetical protein